MDPQMLVDPTSNAALPAPFWFVQFFKTLGFCLHMVPMNLWFAGILLAMLLRAGGGGHGVVFSRRLMRQMPILIAYGVNFGIVPLLFIQLAYYQFFYPATILMAWWWMAIVVLLIPAYYGIYIYAFGLRDDDPTGPALARRCVGWGSAVLFVTIGFLFVNGFSLMDHAETWPSLWRSHRMAGAALGTGLSIFSVENLEILPRWLLMFGLALGTTAAWMVLDAAWFARDESAAYRNWAARFALRLTLLGASGFAVAGSWYVFGTWSPELRATMFAWPAAPLTVATAVAPGLPVVLLLLLARRGFSRATATAVGVAQFGVLAVNAISRQVVQNVRIGAFVDLVGQPVAVDWSPLVLFLVLFVLGALLIFWMVVQVVRATQGTA
ncbi:MAG: hypothetical protein JW888_09655 [Pirellulales bacterium]|nr:hypothetical protein [Pirellulales bacterium]